jgi:HAE1 family hydrophobic/amphiphilic exporter-1
MDGTQEIGLAVLATTLSIVAVFLPIGFMGGIIGKFFHEFGITIVAAVLISMFVSFTLDPMLSSVWHDPASTPMARGRHLYDRTLGRVTGWFDRATDGWPGFYQRILRWSLAHKLLTLAAAGHFRQHRAGAAAGHRVRAQGRLLGNHVNFYTPRAPRSRPPRPRPARWTAIRALPEVRYTLTTINTGNAQARLRQHLRAPGGPQAAQPQRGRDGPCCASACAVPGITVTHVGLLDPVGGQKQIEFSLRGRPASWSA